MCCSFCSAANLQAEDLTPEEIADTANKIKASSIILLGGEALCMPPEFYWQLLSLTDATLDFTTNLKDFYLHPDKWTELFRQEKVSVCTSFNYGDSRRWTRKQVYTEEQFKDVMNLFHQNIGYMPMFISVIDQKNAHLWRNHIELARELCTRCRLNNALKLGRQGTYFSRADMFAIWIQIVKEHLDAYEMNCLERKTGRCPLNTCQLCSSTIRVVQKNQGKLLYYNCDDRSNMGMGELDKASLVSAPVRQMPIPMFVSCYTCKLFHICNGCQTNLLQIQDKEEYCKKMKTLEDDIISLGWRLS